MIRVLLAVLLVAAPAAAEDAALARARRVLAAHPVIDGHNDLPWAIRESATAPRDVAAYDLRARTTGNTDLARLKAGHVGGQFWSVYTPGESEFEDYARIQLEQIDIARQVVARYPELVWALTADEMERAARAGTIGSALGLEGGHAIQNSLGALRAYYDLGVRYMTLTHNVTLDWADAASEPGRHGGLTRFGEEVVREMNRLGMLVDLSHVSPETMDDALRVSEAPVIFSHSSARALDDVPRNVPDAVLSKMKANGGVVMVTFVPGFISKEVATAYAAREAAAKAQARDVPEGPEKERVMREYRAAHPLPRVTVAQVADHVEHVRRVAGADHVGIGGDYDGNDDWPVGMEDVSTYPVLFAELVRRGWSDEDLARLARGNILRAMRQAEVVAKRLQAARGPSTATIESVDGR
ncbi:MAG TPA: dipeptidase [Vicinamibacteria bacterium]|nr:dipeptidase [Vicinamibacteria bacterium]